MDQPAHVMGDRLGWKAPVAAGALYLACVVVLTGPTITTLTSDLPNLGDPLIYLTVLRWYRTCLLEGTNPLVNLGIQYPIGQPIGLNPPFHLLALMYVPLSFVISNDVLIFNLMWLFGLVTTGLGAFALTWALLRDRTAATFAGLALLLSTPLAYRARAHLDMVQMGGVPLFFLAWVRFVDRPGRGRLLAAVVLFLLVVASASYFAVLAVFPAALYPVYRLILAGRGGAWAFARGRAGWFAAFVGLALPPLVLLFAGHVWTAWRGYPMTRAYTEFTYYGSPWWAYLVPTPLHRSFALVGRDLYTPEQFSPSECGAFLGFVTLGLLGYAAVRRAPLPRAGYWWASLGLLVVLSFGASWTVWGHAVPLPSGWLWQVFPPFRLIRCPSRFNLFATVVAALLAAAGLSHLLRRVRRPSLRIGALLAVTGLLLADAPLRGFHTERVPPMPEGYSFLRTLGPGARVVEVPHVDSSAPHRLSTLGGYWQSFHRQTTTAGCTSHDNRALDNLLMRTSPFNATRLADPSYLAAPERETFPVVGAVDYRDYIWLYLTAHGLDYVMVHRWAGSYPEVPGVRLDRIEAVLAEARIYDDGETAIYERAKLAPPRHPIAVTTSGWKFRHGRPGPAALKHARIAVYNPDPAVPVVLDLETESRDESRTMRVLDNGTELAQVVVPPGGRSSLQTPALALAAGFHVLTLESDRAQAPVDPGQRINNDDRGPYSFVALRAGLTPVPAVATAAGERSSERR